MRWSSRQKAGQPQEHPQGFVAPCLIIEDAPCGESLTAGQVQRVDAFMFGDLCGLGE